MRTFAVERIQKIEVKDEGFDIPADFSPSEYSRAAFGIFGGQPETVELVFAPVMAGYIRERNWHESQQIADDPDGSVRLTMDVALGFELKAWIKGFLPHVTVVRPTQPARRDRARAGGRGARLPGPGEGLRREPVAAWAELE